MRPQRLEMAGFSAFREPTVVDFTGADLIALVGATGAGKSSIIDGITFALYGDVSRYDDRRAVAPVVHTLCPEAKVRLDFEVDGEPHTAVRVVRRTKTGATVKEARLVHTSKDGIEIILAGSAREMGKAVEQLLGLSFDQFTRTVVLPQGEFAAFLHEDKRERQQLLRQLLDAAIYARMGQIARERAAGRRNRADVLTEQRDAKGAVSPEELASLKARAKDLGALQKAVATQLRDLAEIDKELEGLDARIGELEDQQAGLQAIKVPPAVTKLAPQLAAASEQLDAANEALGVARTDRDAAQKAAAASPAVHDLMVKISALERLAEIDGDLSTITPLAAEASANAADARTAADEADEALATADSTLRTAQDAAGLKATIASLVIGEPCPVCSQTVHELPEHDVDAELGRATKAFENAKRASTKNRKDAEKLEREATTLATRVEALSAERTKLAQANPVKEALETLQQQLDTATNLAAAADAALEVVTKAEATHGKAEEAARRLRDKEQDLRQDLLAARDPVSHLKPPRPAGKTLDDDWTNLAEWAAGQLEAHDAALESAEQDRKDAGTRRKASVDGITDACSALGVTAKVEQVAEALATAVADARHEVEGAEARQKEVVALGKEIAELESGIAVHQEMGRLLSATGFERWLLQTALDDLVERATVRLLELSGGQYSLESDDGDFSIRDHRNADELRGVRTLSGGETFLASLSLALALAENIAELAIEGGPRIDSMFLDEGFGTLDPATLDTVAATMEDLSASGRLIGVVTHIRDLADRMPVRFEVTKDNRTARVERVEV